jgi:hypothetical protein
MGKNTVLSKKKEFKNIKVFTTSLNKLISVLYSNQFLDEEDNKLHFGAGNQLDGVTAELHPHGIHLKFSYDYIRNHLAFQENKKFNIPEINTLFNYNVNLQYVCLYPNDRDEFPDTPLGMEQRAAYFMVVLQVALEQILTLNK